MNYYSLNKISPLVDFKEAAIRGQAPDKGLYFPGHIPQVSTHFINSLEQQSNEQIAFDVIRPFTGDTIVPEKLFNIIEETINFPIPLVQVSESIYSLELFHGPTLAFKDVGARFMSRCFGYFVEQGIRGARSSQQITVLVATSGDTGGAVANGFYGVEGVEVIILYPSGKVSAVQEKQLTAMGGNIHALEIQGSFDDCQSLVKSAFADKDISKKLFLTSANSINVARWLPQQFYYFFAIRQWKDKGNMPVISVPSGNFGNLCAGLLAMRSGLPVAHFIAACNKNDVVTRYLQNSVFEPRKAIPTLSNAMDVGEPSNFVRILEIFQQNISELKQELSSDSITDEETIRTISETLEAHNYTLDPHGAVAYLALQRHLKKRPEQKGIFLETAHPVKFPDAVIRATATNVTIPENLQQLMDQPKKSIIMNSQYGSFKEFLLSR